LGDVSLSSLPFGLLLFAAGSAMSLTKGFLGSFNFFHFFFIFIAFSLLFQYFECFSLFEAFFSAISWLASSTIPVSATLPSAGYGHWCKI
jgi:hypothetical protein